MSQSRHANLGDLHADVIGFARVSLDQDLVVTRHRIRDVGKVRLAEPSENITMSSPLRMFRAKSGMTCCAVGDLQAGTVVIEGSSHLDGQVMLTSEVNAKGFTGPFRLIITGAGPGAGNIATIGFGRWDIVLGGITVYLAARTATGLLRPACPFVFAPRCSRAGSADR